MKYTPDQPKVPGADVIYRPAGEAGEYAPLATNPYKGCGHKCAYCLHPDTPIQMADGTARRIADIKIGDAIIGVEKRDEVRRAWNWKFVRSTVLNKVETTNRPVYRITLENGAAVVCSSDHRWLTERGWKFASTLTLNNEVRTFSGPATATAEPSDLYRRGYVAVANGMVSHNCYVPLATHQDRPTFDAGAIERPDFRKRLTRDAERYEKAGVDAQVMLSFATDPYHPGDTSLTSVVLDVLKGHGLGFCTLTKGGTRALRDLHRFRPDRDAFAATLTTLDDAFSRKWERGAPLPADRIAALKAFRDRGIFTWVSLEPTLDVEASLELVRETHGFVDLYKIGRANYLKEITRTTDWRDYTLRMIDLCQRLGVKHYIKRSLQEHLPTGYHNPLRVAQHH